MQQPTRYYITRSGDELKLRSVRIARPASQLGRGSESEPVRTDSMPNDASNGVASPSCGASVKERLQEAIRKHAPNQ